MERLYLQYRDIAEFRLIYINEAHAADGGNPAEYARSKGLKRHDSMEQRCYAAESLIKDKQLTVPTLIDDWNNTADLAYHAWPDKVFLVRKDGLLAIAGEDGPYGFAPAIEHVHQWLSEFRETGTEPKLKPAVIEDFRVVVAGENRPDGPQESFLKQAMRGNNGGAGKDSLNGEKTGYTLDWLKSSNDTGKSDLPVKSATAEQSINQAGAEPQNDRLLLLIILAAIGLTGGLAVWKFIR